MGQIVAAPIADRKLAEHVVEDGACHLDGVIAFDSAPEEVFDRVEGIGISRNSSQRYPYCRPMDNANGEVVHQRAEGRAFLLPCRRNDFTDRAVNHIHSVRNIDLVPRRWLSGCSPCADGQLVAIQPDVLTSRSGIDHAFEIRSR